MSVKTITSRLEMQCRSSDSKPSASDGATLHIVDTGEQYIADDGDWLPDLRMARSLKMAKLLE